VVKEQLEHLWIRGVEICKGLTFFAFLASTLAAADFKIVSGSRGGVIRP
jgi:hypothetical protein